MKAVNTAKNRRLGFNGCKARVVSLVGGRCYFEVEHEGRWKKFHSSEEMFMANFESTPDTSDTIGTEEASSPFSKQAYSPY